MSDLVATWLEDEESKFIFEKRILYNNNHDYGVFKTIVDKYVPELSNNIYYPGKEKNILDIVKGKSKIWLGGGGIRGRRTINMLQEANIKVDGVIDRDDTLHNVMGIPVFQWDQVDIGEINLLVITIANKEAAEEYFNKAIRMGMSAEEIILLRNYNQVTLEDKQYFEEFINYDEGESFIDAGALDLLTSIRFAKKCMEKHISNFKIYAFEPDRISYVKCKKIKSKYPEMNIELMNYGLWSSNAVLGFSASGYANSRIIEEGSDVIKCVTLDSVVKERVTFIKMDIEGAELEALRGCKNIISQYKPKLAISVYHKPSDIIEIPKYIKQLVPEYKLYLRHYSNCSTETILYALP